MTQQLKIIIPILPGKAEAWRRFLQELEGSQACEFSNWCNNLGVEIKQVSLHDSLGGALVLLNIAANEADRIASNLKKHTSPFSRWFVGQVQTLHGLDLNHIYRA